MLSVQYRRPKRPVTTSDNEIGGKKRRWTLSSAKPSSPRTRRIPESNRWRGTEGGQEGAKALVSRWRDKKEGRMGGGGWGEEKVEKGKGWREGGRVPPSCRFNRFKKSPVATTARDQVLP